MINYLLQLFIVFLFPWSHLTDTVGETWRLEKAAGLHMYSVKMFGDGMTVCN